MKEKLLKPFKAVWNGWKKRTVFFKIMIIYSVVLVCGVIGLCIWEWGVLEDYQSDYDKRYAEAEVKAAGGEELCIAEYVDAYTSDVHRNLLLENIQEESLYYSAEELVDYKMSTLDFNSITYKKNEENYQETRPVYDIYAGDEMIATVTLSPGSIDEFGFNTWKINGTSVDANIEYLAPVELTVEDGMTVMVGETVVSEECITGTSTITENIYNRVYELTGAEETMATYTVTDIINADDIRVVDGNSNEISYTMDGDVRKYCSKADQSVTDQCTAAVDPIVQAYVQYTSKWITMEQMITYTVPGSAAESAMKRAADSIEYTKTISGIEYTSKTVDNINKVTSDVMYCDVVYEMEKILYGDPVTETISFTLLIRNINGVWLLEDMAYNG